MTAILDTHFLIWIIVSAQRLGEFPWLNSYRPWGISPVSFLEIQFLLEVGRLEVQNPEFMEAVMDDSRFMVDEVPLIPLIRHALLLDWTRDPFDRLLCAHSQARRLPLCSVDQNIREQHRLIVPELLS
ncbi:MAG: type II toxin-antitoxin system VapC family toxin [Acidobacteriota bacterium]